MEKEEEQKMMEDLIEVIFHVKKKKPTECNPSIFNDLANTIKRVKGYKITQQKKSDTYAINDPVFYFISDVWSKLTPSILTQLGLSIDQKDKISKNLYGMGYRVNKE